MIFPGFDHFGPLCIQDTTGAARHSRTLILLRNLKEANMKFFIVLKTDNLQHDTMGR